MLKEYQGAEKVKSNQIDEEEGVKIKGRVLRHKYTQTRKEYRMSRKKKGCEGGKKEYADRRV